MKKLFFLFLILTFTLVNRAQSPEAFNYQFVARDDAGNLIVNQSISLRISILEGTVSGTVVNCEIHLVTTNQFGLATLQIGNGTVISGTFNDINWGSDSYYIKTEMDPLGGQNYQLMGISQLLSVPYSLFAKSSGVNYNAGPGIDITDYTISNTAQNATHSGDAVGATNLSVVKLQGQDVSTNAPATNQILQWNGSSWTPSYIYSSVWSLSGNSGTNPSTSFLGTTDNAALNFRVNNQKAGTIEPSGSLFLGFQSGYNNTVSGNCTGIGSYSLYSNTGCCNTACGYLALNSNTSGQSNTAIGVDALKKNTSGAENASSGSGALFNNTTGYFNTANGFQSLYSNNSGYNNTALGHGAFYNGASYSNSTALGYNANITASNQVRIGNSNVTSIGGFAGWTNISDARCKKEITETVPGLTFIMKLRPVTYYLDQEAFGTLLNTVSSMADKDFEENINLQTGFIAQEVEKAASECEFNFSGVDKPKNKSDLYGLRYAEFTVPLVKAVQELNIKCTSQEKLIVELQIKLEALQKEMDEFKKQLDKTAER